jgi:hypothetical protein
MFLYWCAWPTGFLPVAILAQASLEEINFLKDLHFGSHTRKQHIITMAKSKVKDMGLAEFRRRELNLVEHEMPGLMAARKEFGAAAPFKGLNISGGFSFVRTERVKMCPVALIILVHGRASN